MTVTRLAAVVAALLALLLVAAPAGAAPLDDSIRGLLTQASGAKARKGMGLPPYASILGKGWKAKVRKADAKLVGTLAPAARAAAAGDGVLKASDTLKRGAERQKRQLRLAVALDSMCPVFNAENPDFGATISATARGEHVVATVERVRGYDITTIVTLETQWEARVIANGDATLTDPRADWGKFSVVRQQTARNLKTGKLRSTGPTQRMRGSLDPFFNIETGFDDFVRRNADGNDESPAPRRPQRSAVWNRVAQDFVITLYMAMRAEYAKAAAKLRTPNACMTLDVPAPTHLSPGQKVDLTGILRPRQGNATLAQLLRDARITAYLENEQGQTARSPAAYPLEPGEVWYEFVAPKKKWPDSRPIGIEITAVGEGGIATQKVFFRAREQRVPPRFEATMSVSGSSAAGEYREMAGSAVYKLQSALPGPDGSLNAWYEVEQSTITSALGTLGAREGCRYEAKGAGGTLDSGDLELRILPDGQMIFAFMLDHKIATSYLPTDCPPGSEGPPIEGPLTAHLDTRRPGGHSLRPLPADFQHSAQNATDVYSALLDTSTASWVVAPKW